MRCCLSSGSARSTFGFRPANSRPGLPDKADLTPEYSRVILSHVDAKELRAIRERMGLLQVDLAARLGVTQGALSRWETASRPIPEPVARLARLLAEQQPKTSKRSRTRRKR